MKPTETIQAQIRRLKQAAEEAGIVTKALIEHGRYGDAAKSMQEERSLRDQIALLEWVLKP